MSESTDPYVLPVSEAAGLLAGTRWRRLAIIGDSIAEGVREPSAGYRDLSWTDRVEEALSIGRPDFAALNLGRRNLVAAEIRATQLDTALAFEPDLAFVIGGGNDMLRPHFDDAAVRAELTAMVAAFREIGADVCTLGMFDFTKAGLLTGEHVPGLRAAGIRLNQVVQEVTAAHDGIHVAFFDHPAGGDPDIYARDRLHLNARGHAISAAETIRALAAHSGHLASA
jgi:lysophospholipase L1-like esterase